MMIYDQEVVSRGHISIDKIHTCQEKRAQGPLLSSW